MAVAGRETWDSRNVTISPQSPDSVLKYFIQGTYDPEEVNTWLIANVPLIYGVLWLQDFKISNQGGGCWFVDAQYGDVRRDGLGKNDGTGQPLDPQGQPSSPPAEPTRPQPTDNLGPEYSFEVTGEPVHITQSEGVVAAVSADPLLDPPDFKGAIGLTDDSVQGVDVERGILRFSETRKVESITREYLNTLAEMVGTVCNSHGFWGFKQREVRFDGASGQGHNDDTWTITYRFSVRKWRDDVVVSPQITLSRVFGWDYIDVLYGDETDEDIKVRIPIAAFVHQIYPESDFSKLGIGK